MTQANITSPIYGKLPTISKNGDFFYVFIFFKDQLSSHEVKLIRKKHQDIHCQMNILGYSLKDYLKMEEIICLNAKKNEKPPQIILVSNCQLANQILSSKDKTGGLDIFSEVFLCFRKKNLELYSYLMKKYADKINPEPYSLIHIIDFVQKTRSFLNLQSSMTKMFYQMNQNDEQFTSLRIRLRVLACINLQPELYKEYLAKFKKYLINIYKLQSLYLSRILNKLNNCIQLLNENKIDSFCIEVLQLYQNPLSYFNKIMNYSMLQLCKKQFNFQQIALPLCLMFKAIKLFSKNFDKIKDLSLLFKQDDYITLYRLGYSSKQQTNRWASKKGKYLENLGFLSTSLTKHGALRFLKYQEKKPFNFAFFKIKLFKPQFDEIQTMLPFIYQSFALPPYNHYEKQVVLNSLSIFYVTNVSQISIKQLRQKYSALSDKYEWIKFGDYTKLPVIHMQCNNFLKKLKNFGKQSQKIKMASKEAETIRNYIIGLEKLSRIDRYCLADAFLHEKKFQKIKIYKEQVSSFVSSTQASQIQSIRNSIRQSVRESNIAYQTGNQGQAILNLRKAISLKQELQTKDKSRCFRESSQDINRDIEKIVKINQNFKCPDEAKKVLDQKIRIIRQKLQLRGPRISDRFQLVELLNILGLYFFRMAKIKQARGKLRESKEELNHILIILDYDNLKKETFYIEWILHFFLKDERSWKNKDVFQKQRRSENIAEITKNFGIEDNLEDVISSSKQLQSKVMSFLKKRQQMIEELQLTQEQKQRLKENLLKQIQEQFKKDPILQQLKPKIQDFFKNFEKSKKNFEDTIQNGIMKKINQLQGIIIEDCSTLIGAQFKKRFQQIIKLKQNLTEDLIKEWLNQKKGNIPIQQISEKFHTLIISLRYNYFHMYRKQMRKNYKNARDLNEEAIKIINNYHKEAKKFKSWQPSFQKLLMNSKKCELYIQAERIEQAEGLLRSLVQQSKENSYFATILFDSYEMLIRIYDEKADISYMNWLDYTNLQDNIDLKMSLKRMSSQIVAQCEEIVFQALMDLQDIKRKETNDVFSRQIDSIHLKLKLVQQKLSILQFTFLSSSSSKRAKKKVNQHKKLRNYMQHNTKLLQSYKLQESNKLEFNMIHCYNKSLFFYHSDKQQSLNTMMKSLELSQKLIPRYERLNVLKAGIILFSKQNHKNLETYVDDLLRYEQQMTNYSYYWKITLSLYIYFKFKKDSPQRRIQFIHKTQYFLQFRQSVLKRAQQKIEISVLKAINYEYEQNNKLYPMFAYNFSSINKQSPPQRLSIQDSDRASQIVRRISIRRIQQVQPIENSINRTNIVRQQRRLKRQQSLPVPIISRIDESQIQRNSNVSLTVQQQDEADNPQQSQFEQRIDINSLQSQGQEFYSLQKHQAQVTEFKDQNQEQFYSKSEQLLRQKSFSKQFHYYLKTGERIDENKQVQTKIVSLKGQRQQSQQYLSLQNKKIKSDVLIEQQAQIITRG